MEVAAMLDEPISGLREYLAEALDYYIDLIRNGSGTAFTRVRKVTKAELLYQMLTRKGQSQWGELMDFYDGIGKNKNISEQGFYAARMKFNPEAVRVMSNEYIAKIYDDSDDSMKKFKNCLVLAIDGSKIVLPTTSENIRRFGQIKNGQSDVQPAMALMSTLHDSLNSLKLDILVDRIDGSERDLARKHIEHYLQTYSQKAIFTFDRGYPSIRLIDQIIGGNQYFLFRCTSTTFKKYFEQVDPGEDKALDVTYDRISTNEYRDDRAFRQHLMNTTYHLRFTKLIVGTDEEGHEVIEYLVSNLPQDEFTANDLKELYHLRWGTETSYERMKSRMKMEEFSGMKPALILQDIYADCWMFNLVSLKIMYANEHKPIEQQNGNYTISRNFNKSIGAMKKYLLEALVLNDMTALDKIDRNIESQLTWVKNEERSFERKTAVNKDSMSYKNTY